MLFEVIMAGVLLSAGVYMTVAGGFFQLRCWRQIFKKVFSGLLKHRSEKKNKSAFRALTTALAGSVGTGNIVGVSGALALGGPGAIFWMWVSALFNMMLKYAEVLLAVKYQRRMPDGSLRGGPMYYMAYGIGRKARCLSVVFALCCAFTTLLGTATTQTAALADAVVGAVAAASGKANTIAVLLCSGILCAVLVGVVILKNSSKVGAVAEKLVPLMSILYTVLCLFVIVFHVKRVGPAFSLIFCSAFSGLRPVLGGAGGFLISFRVGMMRGIFSNEAGVGSAPIAHGEVETRDPASHALLGIAEVFIDTIVICTMTALVLLVSGIAIPYGQDASGTKLAQDAFSTMLPGSLVALLLAVALSVFAFTSIIGWSFYGVRCVEYVFGVQSVKVYKWLLLTLIAIAPLLNRALIWHLAEILNCVTAMPNVIALLILSPQVVAEMYKYKSNHRFFSRRRV